MTGSEPPFPDAVQSEWTLVRVAGVPVEAVDLVGPRTRAYLDGLDGCAGTLRQLRPTLDAALYALVGVTDDAGVRRAALAAKRAVHRLADLPDQPELPGRLPVTAAAAYREWLEVGAARCRLRRQLTDSLHADVDAAADRLRSVAADPDFAAAAALAAPDWLLNRTDDGPRELRTLYSYVSRAAVKTSPFSRFTTVAVAGRGGVGRLAAGLGTGLAHLALRAAARDPATGDALRLQVAPHRATPAGVLVLRGEVRATGGLCWRSDEALGPVGGTPLVPLHDGPDGHRRAEILAALGGADPWARYLRLLDSGVLVPVCPWERGEDPFRSLVQLLGTGSPLARSIHELAARARTLPMDPARERAGTAAAARSAAREWGRAAAADLVGTTDLVHEDAETGFPVPAVGTAAVRADLAALARWIRPYVFRSHLYDVLVDAFRNRYGAGGRCPDVLGFLMWAAADVSVRRQTEQAVQADLGAAGQRTDRAALPVGATSSPPATAVFFQLVATGSAGRQLVVNGFNPGAGGVVSRFGGLLPDSLPGLLREHLRPAWPEADCRELVLWTDCNTVQQRAGGVFPALVLPGEAAGPAGSIPLAATLLAHEPERDVLTLLGPTGRPIGLPYLGVMPPYLAQGVYRLLLVLADPWINGAAQVDRPVTAAPRDGRIRSLPRRTSGRVVLRRASWLVPADALPFDADADPVTLVPAVDAWRREHGLPAQVFCHKVTTAPTGRTDRKPMWLDWASPLALDAVRRWLDPAPPYVRLVEALPTTAGHPLQDRAGGHRAAEHVALLRWPRPGSVAG